jgi:serine/threonine-protein kinase HipA
MKILVVLINDQVIGIVEQTTRGDYRFTYDEAWQTNPAAVPLSLSMPLTAREHSDKSIRPFMWGLLPDNDETLGQWGHHFGVSPRNAFALLGYVGEDLPGAIQMVPPERVSQLRKREGITRLPQQVLEVKFAELLKRPGATQFTQEGGKFSLAGAQRKKALYLVKGKWYEPRGRTPSTHILKPPIPDLAGQVENEMFCMRLAPAVDLPAPKCWVEHFGTIPVVVTQRYDRVRMDGNRKLRIDQSGGEVRRVHQEDMCQVLRVHPRDKYESDGGPGILQILSILSGSGKPSEDRDRFMRACAFNFVIGGTDAHGKNYSILLSSGGRYRLAPLYDVNSWLPYFQNKKDRKLAMAVDRHRHFDEIYPRHWEAVARKANFNPERAIAHVRDLIARIPDEASHLLKICQEEGLELAELQPLADLITKRCADLEKVYGAEEMRRQLQLGLAQ